MRFPRLIPYRTAWWSDAKEMEAWMSNYQFSFRAFMWISAAFTVGANLIGSKPLREGIELHWSHEGE